MSRKVHYKVKREHKRLYILPSILWFLCIAIVLWFLYIGMPESVVYAKKGFLRWLPFILIFFALPYLLLKFINSVWINNSGWSVGIAAVSVLIVGPTLGIVGGKQKHRELKEKGVLTKGVVIEKWKSTGKGNKDWLIVCKFNVQDKTYTTFSIPDKENIFRLGDTLQILYSPTNPNNSEVVELSEFE